MGFVVGRTITLEFEEGTYLAGAEIVMRSTPVGVLLGLEDMDIPASLPVFMDYVKSWNLEYEDEAGEAHPVPATLAGAMAHLERAVVLRLFRQWYSVALGVSVPLDPPSGDGPPSPDTAPEVPSMQMEVLSSPLVS